MTKEEILKSKGFKIALPILIVVLVIGLFNEGYEFGQWLYQQLN